MNKIGILDPDQHENLCGAETLPLNETKTNNLPESSSKEMSRSADMLCTLHSTANSTLVTPSSSEEKNKC